jgi:5-methylcytosine-specific restriction protein A
MSLAPARPCAHPRCPTLTRRGRCPKHARQYEEQRPNAAIRTWYQTPRWRALRAQVRREEPFCDDCAAEGLRVASTDVDHTVPHRGDPALFWNRANLHAKCHRHHSQKTGRGA